MAPITNPFAIAALLAVLIVPLTYLTYRDARAQRAPRLKQHPALIEAERRRSVRRLIAVATLAALVWGFIELKKYHPEALSILLWVLAGLAVLGWKIYAFLAFPILCGLFAYLWFSAK
jgi:hypothetical protein